MLLDQVGQRVQQPSPLGVPHPRPGALVERVPRRGDGRLGVLRAAERDVGPGLAGPRVDALEAGAVDGLDLVAADEVAEQCSLM